MARRVKEEPGIHRKRIATAAQELFKEKGIEKTSMDEIAKKAGYSKATLYVYFNSKEQIVDYLSLLSMKMLKGYLQSGLALKGSYKERFLQLCRAMQKYEQEYPDYFQMALKKIDIEFGQLRDETEEAQIFHIGEEINALIGEFLEEGIASNVFKRTENIVGEIFMIWGMLSGLISLASEKEIYMEQEIKIGKQEFLEKGYERLYESISVR